LHSFDLPSGAFPAAGLALDGSGNLYGTATFGGASGYGTVFQLSRDGASWTHSVLHSFDLPSGAYPYAGLVLDGTGNLYGTTGQGGASDSGTVFRLRRNGASWTHSVLHHFDSTNGASPQAGLALDGSGNLFGTTVSGGPSGQGTVFELRRNGASWTHSVLHGFDTTNGASPYAGLVLDGSGRLYGTTLFGGTGDGAAGTVFRIRLADNLVANGSFEWGITGWTPNDLGSAARADCTNAFVGACSFRVAGVRGSGRAEEGYVYLRQTLPGAVASSYTFTASSMANGARTGTAARYRALAKFRLSGGGSTTRKLDFSRGTHGWETLAAGPFSVAAHKSIQVEVDYFDQAGTAWFDDIVLRRN